MTDKEKLDKLVAEIERLKNIVDDPILSDNDLIIGEKNTYVRLLSFIDSMQEEPKECMYSKDNYTDEDRKVLCDGCEEECKFNKKEEPVSEDLDKEIDNAHKLFYEEVGWDSDEGARAYVADWFAHYFANWQKKKDDYAIEIAHMAGEEEGKNIMKQQMMAKAVDAVVKIDAGGYPYIPQMELYNYEKDIPLAKEGDKYKVVLIKEG